MTDSEQNSKSNHLWLLALLSAVWVIFFLFVFFQQNLPNNSAFNRLDIVREVPFVVLDFVDPAPDANPVVDSGWKYFPQRLPMIGGAALILAAAWGLGHLLLRAVRLERTVDSPLPDVCAERTVFAFGLGLSALSLLMLGFGYWGIMQPGIWRGLLGGCFIGEVLLQIIPQTRRSFARVNQVDRPGRLLRWSILLAVGCFLTCMFFGALSRPNDFDVCEYHLQGPKEFFLAGQVQMLPHNVYTSFPFLTEMLSLLGMVVCNNWFVGALAGKLVLMTFAPLTALGAYAAGRRWFGSLAGWLAALVLLSAPWTYRISIIAYAEGGLSFYLMATTLAVGIWMEKSDWQKTRPAFSSRVLLIGLLAGSSMATKYPGLVSVVFPAAVVVFGVIILQRGQRLVAALPRGTVMFTLGVVLAVGPWLLKNFHETGNPVYPLLYSVFGATDWDDEVEARWKKAHSPDHHKLDDIPQRAMEVSLTSDWLSPLFYAFAPLALCGGLTTRRKNERLRVAVLLWMFAMWLFASWWVLTHRLDRFWVPMLPVVSLLAGAGAAWLASCNRLSRVFVVGVVSVCVVFNFGFCNIQALSGYNAWLSDLPATRLLPEKIGLNDISRLNAVLPRNARVLCVGEAAVFNAEFDLIYNTVFDDCLIEEWSTTHENISPIRQLAERFYGENISHVFVNWQEILRYRQPGSYGYTDYVTRERFVELVDAELLRAPRTLLALPLEQLSEADRALIEKWSPALISDGSFICAELYSVTIK